MNEGGTGSLDVEMINERSKFTLEVSSLVLF